MAVAPTEDHLRVILKRYLDKGNMEEVNYMDFCKDADKPEDIFTPYDQTGVDYEQILDMRKTNFPNLQYTTKPVIEARITNEA